MSHDNSEPHPSLSSYLWTYLALCVLAALSLLAAVMHIPLGLTLALAIAAAKAVLVLGYFMHLSQESFSFRIAIVIAVLMVALLVGLTALDPLTRAAMAGTVTAPSA